MKSADISKCGKYRYSLGRTVSEGAYVPLIVIMLNPSTADAEFDDPTIKACMDFARINGFSCLEVVNLYAYRATNPKELLMVEDPVGCNNNLNILNACIGGHGCANFRKAFVLCAWGNHAGVDRVYWMCRMFQRLEITPYCLGTNKNGSPKHPLYVKRDTKFQRFDYSKFL